MSRRIFIVMVKDATDNGFEWILNVWANEEDAKTTCENFTALRRPTAMNLRYYYTTRELHE